MIEGSLVILVHGNTYYTLSTMHARSQYQWGSLSHKNWGWVGTYNLYYAYMIQATVTPSLWSNLCLFSMLFSVIVQCHEQCVHLNAPLNLYHSIIIIHDHKTQTYMNDHILAQMCSFLPSSPVPSMGGTLPPSLCHLLKLSHSWFKHNVHPAVTNNIICLFCITIVTVSGTYSYHYTILCIL